MRTKTYNAGASAERDAWLAKLRRMERDGSTTGDISELIEWGLTRKRRYDKRPGGVGRK